VFSDCANDSSIAAKTEIVRADKDEDNEQAMQKEATDLNDLASATEACGTQVTDNRRAVAEAFEEAALERESSASLQHKVCIEFGHATCSDASLLDPAWNDANRALIFLDQNDPQYGVVNGILREIEHLQTEWESGPARGSEKGSRY
jgi:hypothetical protein